MSELMFSHLEPLEPCDDANNIASSMGAIPLAEMWKTWPRGAHLLWLAEAANVSAVALTYWCAERARQLAIQACDAAGIDVTELRECSPICDKDTARQVEREAEEIVSTQTLTKARQEAGQLVWTAAKAARAILFDEEAAALISAILEKVTGEEEHRVLADHVRSVVAWADVERGLRAWLANRG